MKVSMEQENGELLLCCVCGEVFNGTAVLTINVDDKSVEEVYCVPCDLQSSASSTKG